MIHHLRNFWDSLTSSLWFVPSIMTFVALCSAFASIAVDRSLDGGTSWAYGGGPEGAREVLGTIAASMITVAGVSFSVMIVALTLASQQFGPRLLRNFMRDTGNQVVLGTFIATFTYCLIVLRTIRSTDSEFVPHVSVTLAIVFALVSLGVLIYFIHHAAVSIQAPEVIAKVAEDVHAGIERLFPEKLGHAPIEEEQGDAAPEVEEIVADFELYGEPARSEQSGYLQSIENDRLMNIAAEKGLVLLLKCRPGDFVVEGGELARSQPRGRMDDAIAREIQQAFLFGSQRTHLQDIEFSMQQLVEVAVRALSPGINDPFTAVNCIDRIAAALCFLAQRSFPNACRYDAEGKLRVIVRPVSFSAIVSEALDPIRQYGRTSAVVTVRLLEAITTVAKSLRREGDRRALLKQARMIERGSEEALPEEEDRAAVKERFKQALEALQCGSIFAGANEDRAGEINFRAKS